VAETAPSMPCRLLASTESALQLTNAFHPHFPAIAMIQAHTAAGSPEFVQNCLRRLAVRAEDYNGSPR
jgi:hypothetical protein